MAVPPRPARPVSRTFLLAARHWLRTAIIARIRRFFSAANSYEPSRATLFRALRTLNDDGLIETESISIGGATTRHRKLPRAEG
jgi:hypothetical protein